MKSLSLGKQHKLCSLRSIESLFAGADDTRSTLAYPLRAVWRPTQWRPDNDCGLDRFLISIPKRRLHKAVERVRMRRLTREAYRLCHRDYRSTDSTSPLDIAFIYIANELKDYSSVEKAMRRILAKVHCETPSPASEQ